jgi:hypothetical protein
MIPFDHYTRPYRWSVLTSVGEIETFLNSLERVSEVATGFINVYGGILVSRYSMDILSPHKYSSQQFTLPISKFRPQDYTKEGYTIYWFLSKEDLQDFYEVKMKGSLRNIKPRKEVTTPTMFKNIIYQFQYENAVIVKIRDDKF